MTMSRTLNFSMVALKAAENKNGDLDTKFLAPVQKFTELV